MDREIPCFEGTLESPTIIQPLDNAGKPVSLFCDYTIEVLRDFTAFDIQSDDNYSSCEYVSVKIAKGRKFVAQFRHDLSLFAEWFFDPEPIYGVDYIVLSNRRNKFGRKKLLR